MKNSKPQLPRIYVFRGTESARAAIQDLMGAGIPPEWIRVVGGSGRSDTTAAGIRALGIAERDARSLTHRIERGGIVVGIPAHAAFSPEVEAILRRCQAAQEGETATDEQDRATSLPPLQDPIFGGAEVAVAPRVSPLRERSAGIPYSRNAL